MKFLILFAIACTFSAGAFAATKTIGRKPSSITSPEFYKENLGCFDASLFKPGNGGSGFWSVVRQGTDNNKDDGNSIEKVVPLNQDVATLLQSVTTAQPGKFLCLGGSGVGGPFDGNKPEVMYVFSAFWHP